MRNVIEVPTAGIVTKVGTNVPIMLPIVLNAPSVPTVFPLSSRLSTEYFTRDGVTVPSKNSGNTKITIHATNAAIMRKLLLTVKIMFQKETSEGIASNMTTALRDGEKVQIPSPVNVKPEGLDESEDAFYDLGKTVQKTDK